jgi:hypothetical protein
MAKYELSGIQLGVPNDVEISTSKAQQALTCTTRALFADSKAIIPKAISANA